MQGSTSQLCTYIPAGPTSVYGESPLVSELVMGIAGTIRGTAVNAVLTRS